MKDPQSYFTDPIEQELAAEAWKVGGNTNTDPFFTWYPPHQILLSVNLSSGIPAPFHKRVVTARNWITAMRDQPLPWGDTGIERVKTYFKQQYSRDIAVTNTQIANVEHFFTCALFTVMSGVFHIIPTALTIYYEVYLQPIGVALVNTSLISGWNNLKNGWRQLVGPDRQGVVFVLTNDLMSEFDIQQFLRVEPEILDQVPVPRRDKPATPSPRTGKSIQVQPGQYLSLIAKDLYQSVELWPLLWDMNKAQVPNPNRITPGMTLQYKELNEYTMAQIADAKRRSPTWKDYPQ